MVTELAHRYRHPRPGHVTLVLLHGSNQSSGIFERLVAHPLLSSYGMVTLDLPGHGQSAPLAYYDMHTLSSAVKSLLEGLALENCVLVGHSLGGHIALALLQQGLRAQGLVLSATPPAQKPINFAEMFLHTPEVGLMYQPVRSQDEDRLLAQGLHHGEPAPSTGQDLRRTCAVSRAQFLANLLAGQHIDEQSFIRGLRLPMLIVTAEHERFVNNQHVRAHAPSHARVTQHAGGHNLPYEAADPFANELNAFVQTLNPVGTI